MADEVQRTPDELKTRAAALAKDVGHELVDQANRQGAQGMSRLGEGLDRVTDQLEKRVVDTGKIDEKRVQAVSQRVHDAASYLKEKDPKSMLADVDAAIQRHPYRAMAVGLAVGWVVGRLMSRE
jgi:ElaB/YqjD/DUF883 family membrane-anchored ribosome-binding protein